MKKRIEQIQKNETAQLIGWWFLCAFIQCIVMHHLHFSFRFIVLDVFISNGILLLISLVVKQIQKYFHSTMILTPINGGITLAFSLLFIYLYRLIGVFIYPKNEWFLHANIEENIIRTVIAFLLLFLVLYQFWINKHKSFQEKNTAHLLEIERQLNNAELLNIQQQLQPHFLFNSLNSISALTVTQPEEARRMVHLLSDFLRGTLRKDHEKMVNLSEELTYLNLYLEIEKVRFGHRLHIEFTIDDMCKDAKLPTFILQPIVENSIKYGLYGQIGELTISVKAICKNNLLELSISNPYEPETVNASKGIGFGLTSIQKKLHLLFGQSDLLEIQKTTTQFTTLLKIPQFEMAKIDPLNNE